MVKKNKLIFDPDCTRTTGYWQCGHCEKTSENQKLSSPCCVKATFVFGPSLAAAVVELGQDQPDTKFFGLSFASLRDNFPDLVSATV